MSDEGVAIAEARQNRNAIAVTDGSYKINHGTVTYVIEGPEARNPLYGVNVALGHPEDQSLLCNELLVCYGVVTMVHKIYIIFNRGQSFWHVSYKDQWT